MSAVSNSPPSLLVKAHCLAHFVEMMPSAHSRRAPNTVQFLSCDLLTLDREIQRISALLLKNKNEWSTKVLEECDLHFKGVRNFLSNWKSFVQIGNLSSQMNQLLRSVKETCQKIRWFHLPGQIKSDFQLACAAIEEGNVSSFRFLVARLSKRCASLSTPCGILDIQDPQQLGGTLMDCLLIKQLRLPHLHRNAQGGIPKSETDAMFELLKCLLEGETRLDRFQSYYYSRTTTEFQPKKSDTESALFIRALRIPLKKRQKKELVKLFVKREVNFNIRSRTAFGPSYIVELFSGPDCEFIKYFVPSVQQEQQGEQDSFLLWALEAMIMGGLKVYQPMTYMIPCTEKHKELSSDALKAAYDAEIESDLRTSRNLLQYASSLHERNGIDISSLQSIARFLVDYGVDTQGVLTEERLKELHDKVEKNRELSAEDVFALTVLERKEDAIFIRASQSIPNDNPVKTSLLQALPGEVFQGAFREDLANLIASYDDRAVYLNCKRLREEKMRRELDEEMADNGAAGGGRSMQRSRERWYSTRRGQDVSAVAKRVLQVVLLTSAI